MRKVFEVGDRVMTGCGCGTVIKSKDAWVCVDLDNGSVWACDTNAPCDDKRWDIEHLHDSKNEEE